MKKAVLACAALSLAACGRQGASGTATFFVPRAALPALGDGVKVVGTHDSGLLVEAPAAQEPQIVSAAPQAFRFDKWQPEHTAFDVESMQQHVEQIAKTYPTLATLETYGTSTGGRPEYVLTLNGKSGAAKKTELMITAATHGNEISTVDVVLGLADKLLQGYGTDTRLTAMLDNHTIHIVPAVCVDSYEAQTRANEGVDPNREYPYPDLQQRSPVGCIRDVMAYFNSKDIAGSIDYHSAASMVMYPWAYTYNPLPAADQTWLDDVTTRMAATNGFAHGPIASTIYIAQGSSADYYYWQHHTMATAVEVSHTYATQGDPADIINENTESTWLFIENFK